MESRRTRRGNQIIRCGHYATKRYSARTPPKYRNTFKTHMICDLYDDILWHEFPFFPDRKEIYAEMCAEKERAHTTHIYVSTYSEALENHKKEVTALRRVKINKTNSKYEKKKLQFWVALHFRLYVTRRRFYVSCISSNHANSEMSTHAGAGMHTKIHVGAEFCDKIILTKFRYDYT